MSEANLIDGTPEFYLFSISDSIIMMLMATFRQLQNAKPSTWPELVELIGKSSPDISQKQLEELKQGAEKVAAEWSSVMGPAVERFCYETMTTRLTDSFEYYLKKMLTRALRTHPGVLGDSTVSMQELLQCANIDEALEQQIERKVHALTFSGLTEVAKFLKRTFNVRIDRTTESYRIVSEAIEVRHLIVHNQGNVNRRFISNTRRTDLKLGQPYPLDWQWARATLLAFSDLTTIIDSTIIRCLKLTTLDPNP